MNKSCAKKWLNDYAKVLESGALDPSKKIWKRGFEYVVIDKDAVLYLADKMREIASALGD